VTARETPPHEAAARYWDAHHDKSRDPSYWMAHPLCRAAINRRVTGSEGEWPLDWLRRVHVAEPFARGVSWGCGTGAFERSAIRAGIAAAIDGFDVSESSLAEARGAAEREGLPQLRYAIGNFDAPRLPERTYDVVFFHQSLHHVSRLERLFEAVSAALIAGGALYADEYVGPSRNRWTAQRIASAQAVLDRLPARAKIPRRIALPVEQHDPSEAARSGEVAAFLREFFEPLAWRPYGGQLASLVFPYLRPPWLASEAGDGTVREILDREESELRQDPAATHYLVAYGRLKPTSAARNLRLRLRRLARL